jgi:proteic killer suppression protein
MAAMDPWVADFLTVGSRRCSEFYARRITYNGQNVELSSERVDALKYRDKRTEQFAAGKRVAAFQGFERQAYKRLEILEAAITRESLMTLRSNRFEALRGDRQGQYSIRINDQWRICFEWPEGSGEALNIEIVDYH